MPRPLIAILAALGLQMAGALPGNVCCVFAAAASQPAPALPQYLSATGLYAKGAGTQLRAGVMSFSPQYPLWSDGAEKRRWLYLPPGTSIDASRPDVWVFPRGTRLWKEFSHQGRPIETRFIERLQDGNWRFASYVWNEDGSDAVLAPEAGYKSLPATQAPGGRYTVPARSDCLACHGGAPAPVLGVSALQLSPDRDPLAANARAPGANDLTLRELVARGWLRHLPAGLLQRPPRIAAATPTERAALGYLHANCSHCHHSKGGQVPVRLTLAQSVTQPDSSRLDALRSAVNAPSRYRPPHAADGEGSPMVVVPGQADASVLVIRMQSRSPQVQMPPLGTQRPDPEGLALISRWINQDLPSTSNPTKEPQP